MPSFNSFLSDYDAPLPPYDASLALSIPRLIPLIIGSLQLRCYQTMYTSDSAYGAIQGLREVQVSVINGIEPIDRIYRLLDSTIVGTTYIEDSPGVIIPDIPAVPSLEWTEWSILGRLQLLYTLTNSTLNYQQGTFFDGEFEDIRNPRQQMQDIITLLTDGGTVSADQLALLEEILAALGPVA
jgi:hypothetical protein